MFDKFSSIAHNLSVNVEKSSLSRLPPSSMLRFISPTYGGRNDISGMILGDYNKFYNNRLVLLYKLLSSAVPSPLSLYLYTVPMYIQLLWQHYIIYILYLCIYTGIMAVDWMT